MKKILLVIALCISINSFSQVKEATLQASGLTCSMCSKAIYKALVALPFIKEVKPNIQNSTYVISFKEGSQPDFDAIAKAVTGAGFSVAQLKVVMNFNNVQLGSDAHIKIENNEFHFLHTTEKTLNGDKTVFLIDKNFLSAKDFKKYSQYDAMKCYQTGTMQSCCPQTEGKTGDRLYHVTI